MKPLSNYLSHHVEAFDDERHQLSVEPIEAHSIKQMI